MHNSSVFIENADSIKDIVKFCPNEVLYPPYSNLTWNNTSYGWIALRLTGGSSICDHADIMFRGNGTIKFYFYRLPTVLYTHADYQCSCDTEIDVMKSKNAILRILKDTGKFELE